MNYPTHLPTTLSTPNPATEQHQQKLNALLERYRPIFQQLFLDLLPPPVAPDTPALVPQPLAPETFCDWEKRLAQQLRSLGQEMVELACNCLEGDNPDALPAHLVYDNTLYRLLRSKTCQGVDTLFGPINLYRHLYRPVERDSAESAIAPLPMALGIVADTTPALAEAAGRYLAEAGATQRTVQQRLLQAHGVSIGTGRLRQLAEELAERLSASRQPFQTQRLVELLGQADRSPGSRKPVLAVGRDGITLRQYPHGLFEVASCATVTVFDRSGGRLGSVYLGCAPQPGQVQMSEQLSALLGEVLEQWSGPLPRLAYVTDAGDKESVYYHRVLRRMKHPRTGERLVWQRVVDFYHVMTRVWILAGVLLGEGTAAARGWARRMGKLLKKPKGAYRLLRTAAALRCRRVLSPVQKKAYGGAYEYLRKNRMWMQYHVYKKNHVPLGSGLTEAACKTVFTQRLKLSGMRWTSAGASVILTLRVVLLSGIWEDVYRHCLRVANANQPCTPEAWADRPKQLAG